MELEPEFKPKNIIFDFERATINAASKFFNSAKLHGCYFHFCQSVYRNVQNVGLQQIYSIDQNFAHNIRMLMALAFIKPEQVINAYDKLIITDFWNDNNEIEFNVEKQTLLNYFEATYIGKIGRSAQSQRKRPLFDIILWNMHDVTLNSMYQLCFQRIFAFFYLLSICICFFFT